MSFSDQFLQESSPEDLQNIVHQMQLDIEDLKQRVVSVQRLSSMAGEVGPLNYLGSNYALREDGIHLDNGSSVNVNQCIGLGLPDDSSGGVYAIAIYHLTAEDQDIAIVGGSFDKIGGIASKNIAMYNITTNEWISLGSALNGTVRAIAVNADNDKVLVGGDFTDADSIASADYIVRLHPENVGTASPVWESVGGSLNNKVFTILFNGSGVSCVAYIGGRFTNANGMATADYIVKYDFTNWVSIGGQLNADVNTLAINSGILYVGGDFTTADGISGADYTASYSLSGGTWSKFLTLTMPCAAIVTEGDNLYFVCPADAVYHHVISAATTRKIMDAIFTFVLAILGGCLYIPSLQLDRYDPVDETIVTVTDDIADIVYAMCPHAGKIYIGGVFNFVGGVPAHMFAVFAVTLFDILDIYNAQLVRLRDIGNAIHVSSTKTVIADNDEFAYSNSSSTLYELGKMKWLSIKSKMKQYLDAFYIASTMLTDTKDPTGWVDSTAITISYDKTTRKITLTGTLEYYWQGVKYTLASPWTSDAHSASDGNYYLYSSDGSTFAWSTSSWSFYHLMVAKVSLSTSPAYQFAISEMHGLMPWQVHKELHEQISSYRESGGALTGGTYSENTATDAAVTPGFDAAIIWDEDSKTSIAAWTQGTYTTLRIGASSKATFDTAASFPFRSSGSYMLINNPTTGAEAAGGNNQYLNVYQILIPCTGDADSQLYRMVMLQPQTSYSSLAAAQAENPHSLSLGDLATTSPEFVFYARITYVLNSGDGNTGKCRIATGGVTYISGSRMAQISGGNVPTAENIPFTPTGNLSSTNVQAAIVEAATDPASLTAAGVVELATAAEIDAGTDSTRAMPVDQFVASARNVRYIVLAMIGPTTDWSADGSTNVGLEFESPIAGTMVSIAANVQTAGVTGTAVVDVNKNGTTIMGTNKLKWDSSEKTTRTYSGTAAALSVTSLAVGDLLTVDIDTNQTTKAKGLTVIIGVRLS